MPTGYTADVQEGKVTSFREFALKCTRAMGANIMMRDAPMDAKIEAYQPATFYRDQVEKSKVRLYDLERLTIEGATARQRHENDERAKNLREATERKALERGRYEAMLAQVAEWQPPTPDHDGFKKFMIEQLTGSIDFDCSDLSPYYKQDTRSPADYLRDEIARARTSVEDDEKSWQKEQDRTRERNEWNRALFESL